MTKSLFEMTFDEWLDYSRKWVDDNFDNPDMAVGPSMFKRLLAEYDLRLARINAMTSETMNAQISVAGEDRRTMRRDEVLEILEAIRIAGGTK